MIELPKTGYKRQTTIKSLACFWNFLTPTFTEFKNIHI